MPRQIKPAPVSTGSELRSIRHSLNLNQEQFAKVLGVSKGAVSRIEWQDTSLSPLLCERAYTAGNLVNFLRSELLKLERKRDWRSSKNFSETPPFKQLPEPGEVCKCNHSKCKLSPVRDNDWPIFGHLWLFQGRICRKPVYLDTKGRKVSPPRRNLDPRIPAEVCTKCGQTRVLSTRWVKKLQSEIYRRSCRRRKEDPPDFKHDPPTAYWEKNGAIERVPVEVLKTLRHRNPHSFPRPKCERPGCTRFHHAMELSSRAFEKIQRFRCLGPPAHYAFRLIPTGEKVEKIADGHYKWHDLKTGEIKEIKSELAKIRHPRRHPPAPAVDCPDHPGRPLVKRTGPWSDKKSRKLRWGYSPCPSDPADHQGWTCSLGEAPRLVIPRSNRRWKKSKPRRMPEAQRVKAQREYKKLLPELQQFYKFVRSLQNISIHPDEKMRLAKQHVQEQSYKYLPQYWEAITEELEEAVTNPEAWLPSELALEILAKRYGCASSTFHRRVLH